MKELKGFYHESFNIEKLPLETKIKSKLEEFLDKRMVPIGVKEFRGHKKGPYDHKPLKTYVYKKGEVNFEFSIIPTERSIQINFKGIISYPLKEDNSLEERMKDKIASFLKDVRNR